MDWVALLLALIVLVGIIALIIIFGVVVGKTWNELGGYEKDLLEWEQEQYDNGYGRRWRREQKK